MHGAKRFPLSNEDPFESVKTWFRGPNGERYCTLNVVSAVSTIPIPSWLLTFHAT